MELPNPALAGRQVPGLGDPFSHDDDDFEEEEKKEIQWIRSSWFKRLVHVCTMISLISLSMNSPQTFSLQPGLYFVTLFLDLAVGAILTTEMIVDIHNRGIWATEKAYLKSGPRIFNALMVLFLWISVLLQIIEKAGYTPHDYLAFSVLRAPRALVIVRVLKYFINYQIPESVSRRMKQQIWSVSIFFIYFTTLAAVIGVQLFGQKSHHCVKEGTHTNNLTYGDFLIPSSRCTVTEELGYRCPPGFECKQLGLGFMQEKHYFDNIIYSLLTVYVATTQEGWVLVMYDTMNYRTLYLAATYFILLMFFVGWLVKNVFIAVVSETFADMRSQFSKMWSRTKKKKHLILADQVIKERDVGWDLVSVGQEWKKGHAPLWFIRFVLSKWFKYFMWLCVAIDAFAQAKNGPERRVVQVCFTILFDLEVLLKIWCMGYKTYLKKRKRKFEFFLAIGSTIFCSLTYNGYDVFAVFHVLRVSRLIGVFPSLEDFMHQILGTGTKLGTVVIFTLFVLMLVSAISLQLFCSLDVSPDDRLFQTFPDALASIFQILTQEGWVEVMDKVMLNANTYVAPLVCIYFIVFHLFSSVILMSIFVAVILDNLELEEDEKIKKQRKMGEESADTQEKLPYRLRVFEHFKEQPRLVQMAKFTSTYSIPKIRESFMRKFVDAGDKEITPAINDIVKTKDLSQPTTPTSNSSVKLLTSTPTSALRESTSTYSLGRKQTGISALIQESNRRRTLASILSPSSSMKGGIKRSSTRRLSRQGSRRFQGQKVSMNTVAQVSKADIASLKKITEEGTMRAKTQDNQDWDIQMVRQKREEAQRKRQCQEENLRENHPFFDYPLFVLSKDHWLRQFLERMVHARYVIPPHAVKKGLLRIERLQKVLASQTYLEWVMIFVTLLSCISMMNEEPNYRTFDHLDTTLFEYIFVVAMSIELTLKVMADGLIFTPQAVVQNFSGMMDTFIYFVSLIYITWQPKQIPARSFGQYLLLLRCIRPLRIISLVPKMRQVISELFGGFYQILKVTALQFLLMFIFAMYGVQMFSGKLSRCNDATITTKEDCKGHFMVSLSKPKFIQEIGGDGLKFMAPRVWKNPRNYNFDNIGDTLLALFEVLSLEGWLEIRNGIESQVGKEYSFYVHIYVLIGSFIGLTLFVGVVVNNFNENKGTALLTVDQRRWQDLKKRLKLAQPLHLPPRPAGPGFRATLYDICQHRYYKRAVALLGIVNCMALAIGSWADESVLDKSSRDGLINFSIVLTLLHVVDTFLKITALTFKGHWHSRRSRFDMLLSLMGILWVILNFVLKDTASYRGCTNFGVVIIIFRFLTLSGKHNTLKMLMLTVVVSLLKSFFTIAVLVLFMMGYALAGVILFGTVKYGQAINNHANFRNCFNAMILLFRVTTGEDWNKLMHDCRIAPPYCIVAGNYWESDCGSNHLAIFYFSTFYIVVAYVVLNLFIAVIIENFSLFYSSEEDALISNADIRDFQITWNLIDTDRKEKLPVRKVKYVLRLLRGRLEVESNSMLFKQMLCEIEKIRGGAEVSFHDVLNVLAYRSIDITKSLQLEELLSREEFEYAIEEEVAIATIRAWFRQVRKKRAEKARLLSSGTSSVVSSSMESLNKDSSEEEEPPPGSSSPASPHSTSSLQTPKATSSSPPTPRSRDASKEKSPATRKKSQVSFLTAFPPRGSIDSSETTTESSGASGKTSVSSEASEKPSVEKEKEPEKKESITAMQEWWDSELNRTEDNNEDEQSKKDR